MSAHVLSVTLSAATGNVESDYFVEGLLTHVYVSRTFATTGTITITAEYGGFSHTLLTLTGASTGTAMYTPTALQQDTTGTDASNRQPLYIGGAQLKVAVSAAASADAVTVGLVLA